MIGKWASPFRCRLLQQANAGPSVARNHGAREAAGETLFFLDDDIEASPRLLKMHAEAQQEMNNLVLIGPQSQPIGEKYDVWLEWEHRMLENQYRRFESGEWQAGPNNLYSGNFSVHKKLFFDAGGFDEKFIRQEDVELGYRLADKGAHFRFEPKASAIHRPNRTLDSWFKTPYLYGVRDVQMARDKGVDQIISLAQKHYQQRNVITRLIARLITGKPLVENTLLELGKKGIATINRTGPRPLGFMLCSLVFNLRYLQGMSQEMGDRKTLWRTMNGKITDVNHRA